MKLTIGNIRLLLVLGCIVTWVAVGFIGYHAVITAWNYFHKP
ncbi:hypothetical protein [Klebsiella electrica]|uniref:Uncharacterized protein n=1 Tax=Klebsiella electrica TaxID=1259973 RepID=A0AAJ5QQN6_9ENTR|nr:hypothetical protein [Klebsiella electrica]WBW59830.1 hypothetical protein OR613_17550 [Klebsiella electrica]